MVAATDTAGVSNGFAPTAHPHKGGAQEFVSTHHEHALDIIDIRCAAVEINLKDEINALFKPKVGPRKLPTLLLYDERGLQLFEEANLPLVTARAYVPYWKLILY